MEIPNQEPEGVGPPPILADRFTDLMYRYGVIAGAGFSSWLFTEFYSGLAFGSYRHISGFVAPIWLTIMIVACIIAVRKRQGFLRIPQGIRVGLGTSLVAAMMVGIATYIYSIYLYPELVSRVPDAKVPDENPFHNALIAIAGLTAFGAIVSLIASLVLRKKPRF